MKNKNIVNWYFSIVIMIFFMSCAANKSVRSLNELSGDKLVIVGLVEYDYTQLDNKNINGIELLFDSEGKNMNFQLSKKYLPRERLKEYDYIKIIGDKGFYDLYYKQKKASSSETDNLLSLMDMERNTGLASNNILQRYALNDGKIMNIGKIVVRYSGGNVESGNISYSYSFHSFGGDTLALHAFKDSYPLIYSKYKNDIYFFKSDLEKCIEFILHNISDGKSLMIKNFMDEHPDRIKYVFKDLTYETQEKFAITIEKLTFEELHEFLYENE